MRGLILALAVCASLFALGCGDDEPKSNLQKQIERAGYSSGDAAERATQIEDEVDAEIAAAKLEERQRSNPKKPQPQLRSLDEVESSGDQYALAREIGYELCADPIYPDKAAADPVGYAEEQFGGPDGFAQAREAGCLQALGR